MLQPLFAYEFKEEYEENGWHVYDAVTELKRQGLPNDSWQFNRYNENYSICDTYPQIVS